MLQFSLTLLYQGGIALLNNNNKYDIINDIIGINSVTATGPIKSGNIK